MPLRELLEELGFVFTSLASPNQKSNPVKAFSHRARREPGDKPTDSSASGASQTFWELMGAREKEKVWTEEEERKRRGRETKEEEREEWEGGVERGEERREKRRSHWLPSSNPTGLTSHPHPPPASFCWLGLNRYIWDNTDKPQLQPQGLLNTQLPMTKYMNCRKKHGVFFSP